MFSSLPMTQAGIGGLGPWELVIVLVIVLIVFGAGKLPTIGNSVGEALKNFKKAVKENPEASAETPPEASAETPKDKSGNNLENK